MSETTSKAASANWHGSLARGGGSVSRPGSRVEEPISWGARTAEAGQGTSPEELIAAAHAGCFSMALSNTLTKAGVPPDQLDVTARCLLDHAVDPAKIQEVRLDVVGAVPGLDQGRFDELVEQAETTCPVSNALRNNVAISVRAQLRDAETL